VRFWRDYKEVEKANPAVVVVDSFRTMVRKPQSDMELQSFIQRLALFLASWQATTFLIGEYAEDELRDNPIFTSPMVSSGCAKRRSEIQLCGSCRL